MSIKVFDRRYTFGDLENEVIIVSGCIASGKTTYVYENKNANDIVIDFDYIMRAITLEKLHVHNENLLETTIAIRNFLYDLVEYKEFPGIKIWIITTSTGEKLRDLISRFNAKHILINTSRDKCINQLLKDKERIDKEFFITLVDKYFERLNNSNFRNIT